MEFKELYTLSDKELLIAVLRYLDDRLRKYPDCKVTIRGNVTRENRFEVTYDVVDTLGIEKKIEKKIEKRIEEKKIIEEKKEGRFLRPEKEN